MFVMLAKMMSFLQLSTLAKYHREAAGLQIFFSSFRYTFMHYFFYINKPLLCVFSFKVYRVEILDLERVEQYWQKPLWYYKHLKEAAQQSHLGRYKIAWFQADCIFTHKTWKVENTLHDLIYCGCQKIQSVFWVLGMYNFALL